MPTVTQAIDIQLPVQVVYERLTQFQSYPRFMQDIESVHPYDERHLHWMAKLAGRDLEWDAAITEQVPNRCIAWQSISGPVNIHRIELQAVEPQASRLVFTIESDEQLMQQMADMPFADSKVAQTKLAQRIECDLVRLKKMLENESRALRLPAAASTDDANEADHEMPPPQATQSEALLSSGAAGPETDAEAARFSVAEEVNLDQHADAARGIGQMPTTPDIAGAAASPAEAVAQSLQPHDRDGTRLQQAIERAVPRSQ